MLTRRQFLLASAGVMSPGLILPSFYEQAFSYLENHDEPLLVPPKQTRHLLYVIPDEGGDYLLYLDSPKLEPPEMTWRQFMEHYFGSVEAYLGIEDEPGAVDDFGYDLDGQADFDTVVDCWWREESPVGRAFHLLKPLELGLEGSHPDSRGELIFIDGDRPGSNYLGVHLEDRLTASILQHELNRLGQEVKVELR